MNYNGANSCLDFGLIMKTKSIGEASPVEIRETVPFMSGDYDFTGKCAPVNYNPRKISVSFKMFAENENELFEKKTRVVRWLSARGVEMHFDSMKDYIFRDCTCNIKAFKPFNKDTRYATLDVEITAYPYIRLNQRYTYEDVKTYTGSVNWLLYQLVGVKAYSATNRSPDTMSFQRPQGVSNLLVTIGTLPDVPCIVDLAGDRNLTVKIYNTSTVLPRMGGETIDGVYHSYWKYIKSLYSSSSSLCVETSDNNVSAKLYASEQIYPDISEPIVIRDDYREYYNGVISSALFKNALNASSGIKISSKDYEEVL